MFKTKYVGVIVRHDIRLTYTWVFKGEDQRARALVEAQRAATQIEAPVKVYAKRFWHLTYLQTVDP